MPPLLGEGFGLPAALPLPERLPLGAGGSACEVDSWRLLALPSGAPPPPPPALALRQLFGCQLLGSMLVMPPPALPPWVAREPEAAWPMDVAPTGIAPLPCALIELDLLVWGAVPRAPGGPPAAPAAGACTSSTFAARSAARPAAATCGKGAEEGRGAGRHSVGPRGCRLARASSTQQHARTAQGQGVGERATKRAQVGAWHSTAQHGSMHARGGWLALGEGSVASVHSASTTAW